MKAAPTAETPRTRTRRNAAVVVTDPRLVVVESAVVADRAALDDALGILVTWAIRACSQAQTDRRTEQRPREAIPGCSGASTEAPTPQHLAAYGPED